MSVAQSIVRFRPNPNAQLRLFCFPFAGGGTRAYREWSGQLASHVEVCVILLGGREMRLTDPPLSDLMAAASMIVDQICPYLDTPFAFFGHSMGSTLAFEITRELRRRQQRLPEILFVSGSGAPHLPRSTAPLSHLPDLLFLEALQKLYQNIPQVVFDNDELRGLVLPMLRADLLKVETYRFQPEPPLPCPFVALGGLEDEVSKERLLAWSQHTVVAFNLHMLPGGHFFINSERKQVLKLVTRYLTLIQQTRFQPVE